MKTFGTLLFLLLFAGLFSASALAPDSVYQSNIKSVRLNKPGNQLSMPVLNLNGNNRLELSFDDLDADVKYYYYTYILCDYQWKPANLGSFDYIKGFTQNRISQYRFSSVALTRYTHYQTVLPEQNSFPTKSGNYILLVYRDGDTSKVAFTKRLLVVENKSGILAKVTQPSEPQFFKTHQKVQFSVDLKSISNFNAPQQVHVVVMQNYRWGDALTDVKPAFIRGSIMEFNSPHSCVFSAGKEWRWLDIRDFHLQSDRVLRADYGKRSTEIYLRNDVPFSGERYVYYRDMDGKYLLEAIRGINPFYEGDYATVHFSLVPPNGEAFAGKDIYLFGQLTNYDLSDNNKMKFDPSAGKYTTDLLMKQGYYDFNYLAVDKNNPADRTFLDGNYYEAENIYTILIYYRSFTGRHDELIGVATVNSRVDQPGMSF